MGTAISSPEAARSPGAAEAHTSKLMATHGKTVMFIVHQHGFHIPVLCSGSRRMPWTRERCSGHSARCSGLSRVAASTSCWKSAEALAIHTGGTVRGKANNRGGQVDAALHAVRLHGAAGRLRSKGHVSLAAVQQLAHLGADERELAARRLARLADGYTASRLVAIRSMSTTQDALKNYLRYETPRPPCSPERPLRLLPDGLSSVSTSGQHLLAWLPAPVHGSTWQRPSTNMLILSFTLLSIFVGTVIASAPPHR